MEPRSRTADQVAAQIAEAQEGLATREQLLAAGVSAAQIKRRLRRGSFHRAYRGVYRIGHRAPNLRSRYLAAVLACGEGALLSGRAAGYVWGLVTGAPPTPHVTTPKDRRPEGVTVRRCRSFDSRDAGVKGSIPITTVARTLVDLAAELSVDDLARACHEAGVRYDTTPRQVDAALRRRPNSTGSKQLISVLRGERKVALSKLERRFLRLLGDAGLPLPDTNRPAGGRRVDCRWPEQRLTVELDSYTYHRSRHSWEQDRRREREAYRRGDQFRRYTWADVCEQPRLMLRELRRLLPTQVGEAISTSVPWGSRT